MKGVIFDTETTGLPNWKAPETDPTQPMIVQLGCMYVEIEHQSGQLINVGEYETLAFNPWVKVDPKAAEVTGIDDEKIKHAPHIHNVMTEFMSRVSTLDFVICHNAKFDTKLVRTTIHQLRNHEAGQISYERLTEIPQYCTMLSAKNILKLPGKFGDYKWPSLEECYQHFFGKSIEGAHDAMVDVRATFEVANAIGFMNLVRSK